VIVLYHGIQLIMNRLDDCIKEIKIQLVNSISHLSIVVQENRRSPLEILKSGWSKSGLYPFSPERVLKDIQKPLPELYIPIIDKVKVEFFVQSEVLRTPITSEALTLLQSRVEKDSQLLDSHSKLRVQKLISAAEKTLAERALLLNEIRILFEQNNESNCRKSTRSTIVSKAKVMSYEDFVDAQAKRDAKEATQ
jgi:hypothetical protein